MGNESADLVHRMFDAFRYRDVAAGAELVHPEMEFTPVVIDAPAGTYVGLEGILRYIADADEMWDEFRYTVSEVVGDDPVAVAIGRVYARGGGRVVDSPIGWVFEIRDGRLARLRAYLSRDEAMASAGLTG